MARDLEALTRELLADGHWVTAAEDTGETLLIGFDFMPRSSLPWLKAFEIAKPVTREAVDAAVQAWKAKVRRELADGSASAVVRQMIAEHGPQRVAAAMGGRLVV